jgi:hypothetical protein
MSSVGFIIPPITFTITVLIIVTILVRRRWRIAAINNQLYIGAYTHIPLQSYNMHPVTCIFRCSHPPFWRLNCGAYLCNHCAITFTSRYTFNPFICPCCSSMGTDFVYVNRYNNPNRQQYIQQNVMFNHNNARAYPNNIVTNNYLGARTDRSNDVVIFNNMNNFNNTPMPNQPVMSNEICNICFERNQSRLLNCQSGSNHMLCEVCYQQLIIVHHTKLCPFCRTNIRL